MATRTRQAVSRVADVNGVATFAFEAPPRGYVITGSIGIPTAPSSAGSTLNIGPAGVGVTWGSWVGNATFGPVQAFGQEVMSITATGLVAGSTYDAIFIGYSEEESPSTLIIYPSALATSISTTNVTVPTFHGAQIAKAVDENILTGVSTSLVMGATVFDSDSYVSGNSLVIPNSFPGTYLVTGMGIFTVGASVVADSFVEFFVRVNGNPRDVDAYMRDTELQAAKQQNLLFSGMTILAGGDVVTLVCVQTTGVTVIADGGGAGTRCLLGVGLLGT